MRYLFLIMSQISLFSACVLHPNSLKQRPFYSFFGLLTEIAHLDPQKLIFHQGFLTRSANNTRYFQSIIILVRMLFSPQLEFKCVEFKPFKPSMNEMLWYPWNYISTHVIRQGDPLLRVHDNDNIPPFEMPLDQGYCLLRFGYTFYFLTPLKGDTKASLFCLCTECLRIKLCNTFKIDSETLYLLEFGTGRRHVRSMQMKAPQTTNLLSTGMIGLAPQELQLEKYLVKNYLRIAIDLKQRLATQSEKSIKQHFKDVISKRGHCLRYIMLSSNMEFLPLLFLVQPLSLVKHNMPFVINYKTRRSILQDCPEREPILWDRKLGLSFYERKAFVTKKSFIENAEFLVLFVLFVNFKFPLLEDNGGDEKLVGLVGVELAMDLENGGLINEFDELQEEHEILNNSTLLKYEASEVFKQILMS